MGYSIMETKKVEINCTTGEVVEREMTKDEFTAEKKLQQDEKELIANDPLVAEQTAARQAILDRLGLTTDDLRALGL